MSGHPFLPSAHTQIDTAIIQGGVAYQVAYEHTSKGEDEGKATEHGAHVGGINLCWWLFVFAPSAFWTLCLPLILSPFYFLWIVGVDLGAYGLYRVLKNWRHRKIGTPSPLGVHGAILAGAWAVWFLALWPIAILVALLR